MLRDVPDTAGAASCTDWQTPAQKQMAKWWGYFRCTNYDERAVDWNGYVDNGDSANDALARAGFIPAGFYDARRDIPLKFRKPTAPYFMARAIVAKFTGLLFSAKRHPQILCDDKDTQEWLAAFAKATRLWAQWVRIRNMGGGMGAVGVGLKFVQGRPYLEVHDARFCTVEWEDPIAGVVACLEYRQQYAVEVEVVEKTHAGVVRRKEQRWFWRRRIIDAQMDCVWDKVPVTDAEPEWEQYRSKQVVHGFGFCPVVWVVNDPVDEGTQGDPDCYGTFDMIEDIDALLAQASRGTKSNCDPTLGIASDAEFDDLEKGSGKALQVEKGGEIAYVEMTGAGIDRAQKLVDDLEKRVLTITRCHLERSDGGPVRTASEVERDYSAMTERADIFREQYGECGVKRILEMALRVARLFEKVVVDEDELGNPRITKRVIMLPKRSLKQSDGSILRVPHIPGQGEEITLKWPDYFTPSLESVGQAVNAAGAAYSTFGIMDRRNAVEFIAPYVNVEDVDKTVQELEKQGPPGAMLAGPSLDQLATNMLPPSSKLPSLPKVPQ